MTNCIEWNIIPIQLLYANVERWNLQIIQKWMIGYCWRTAVVDVERFRSSLIRIKSYLTFAAVEFLERKDDNTSRMLTPTPFERRSFFYKSYSESYLRPIFFALVTVRDFEMSIFILHHITHKNVICINSLHCLYIYIYQLC